MKQVVSSVQRTLDNSSKPLRVLQVLSRTVVRRHGIAIAVEDGIQKRDHFLERFWVGRTFHCFVTAWRARFRSKFPRQASWACPLVSDAHLCVGLWVGDTSPSRPTSSPVGVRSTGDLCPVEEHQFARAKLGVTPARGGSCYTRLSRAGKYKGGLGFLCGK